MNLVTQTHERSRWPARRTLKVLDIPPASYYRWRQARGRPTDSPPPSEGSRYALLETERQVIVAYALRHAEVRHREMAWRMLDEGVCAVSPSSVYRVLNQADLVWHWKPKAKRHPRPARARRPNELWQTDIRYVKVGSRNYYLISFLDAYSRYVVHHELLGRMDGMSVSLAAGQALATLPAGLRPTIQSDHGSGFISREFAGTLAEMGVGHVFIRPHTPTDNALIERYHRTIGERIEEQELVDRTQAQEVIGRIIDHYNHRRLHAGLSYLRPVDYYRGDPAALLAARRRKLQAARELRKQENVKLRQRLLPWPPDQTVTYSPRRSVSL